MKIAIATHYEVPEICDLDIQKDDLLAEYLRSKGYEVDGKVWNSNTCWEEYCAVIVRTTWDYFVQPKEFKEWLTKLNSLNIKLFNPYQILLWNMEKTYLDDLIRNGIPIVPTIFFRNLKDATEEALLKTGWKKMIFKPILGGSSHNVEKFDLEEGVERGLKICEKILQSCSMMIQPFVENLQDQGETSLIYFDKVYSHSVRKTPLEDFRLFDMTNIKIERITPPDEFRLLGDRIVNWVRGDLPYARIDLVVYEGKAVVMELELLEPTLFLDKSSAAKFGEAVLKQLQ
ncbi:DgyrCDS8391 [Dimorphilus gyrociliatus]|uniref:DgyrCDS8391 n=1 Tax=Dimorphilus gyrociliatus TaxID=2664684 RepID=A0A7I8VV04_9ANNE|nr:DgyrCDS8391 [Dimorphilus gyrociliatus]